MYCMQCGNKVKQTDKFCLHCGMQQLSSKENATTETVQESVNDTSHETTEKNEVVELIKKAMLGDDSVWGEVYEKTHRYVYFLALKFLRSEHDAQDITQEVYIQAIRSIGQLNSADSFFGWLRSIIYSKCKDMVKKKKPILLDDDENGISPFNDMPETNEEFLPEYVLDSAETRNMVLGLIDDLPYLQRQTIMFYYYDEMTTEQIAALMECPSGTVKSRLSHARQQVKKGVEEYERKGVKLYGIAPLPILTILLREQAKSLLIPQSLSSGLGHILGTSAGQIVSGAAEAGTAYAGATEAGAGYAGTTFSATTVGSTTTTAGMALSTKIAIGAIAAAVVISAGVMWLVSSRDTDVPAEPAPISVSIEAQDPLLESSSTPTPQIEEPDYSEAYAAYLSILQANRAGILNYWRVVNSYGDRYIAIKNICGDDTPELIYIWGTNQWEAKLEIYTFVDGVAKNIYSADIDFAYSAYGSFGLFITDHGELFIYAYYRNESTEWSYDILRLQGNNFTVTESYYGILWEHWNNNTETYEYTDEYEHNGVEISQDEFNIATRNIVDSVDTILMWDPSDFSIPIIYSEYYRDLIADYFLVNATEDQLVSVTYDEAIAFLTNAGNLLPESATTQDESWRHAYAEHLGKEQQSYTIAGNRQIVQFCLTDMDGDGVPELVIFDEYLLRCTVYTFANGFVKELGEYGGGTSYWAWPFSDGISAEFRSGEKEFWTLKDGQMVNVKSPGSNSSSLEVYPITDSNIRLHVLATFNRSNNDSIPNHSEPGFHRVVASNVTNEAPGRSYSPDNVIDGLEDTAWNCPWNSSSIWIRLEADSIQYVEGISILNGYTKFSPDYNFWLYHRNHRPKDIVISFSDGTSITATLSDSYTNGEIRYQDIHFGEVKETTYIMITINSIYESDRWNDVCISEIIVY